MGGPQPLHGRVGWSSGPDDVGGKGEPRQLVGPKSDRVESGRRGDGVKETDTTGMFEERRVDFYPTVYHSPVVCGSYPVHRGLCRPHHGPGVGVKRS